MKKALLVSFILLAVVIVATTLTGNTNEVKAKSFKDVSEGYVYKDIINEMTTKNIITGYEDGTFKPNQNISRKHAAALINRAVDLPKSKPFKKPNDLSLNNPYYNDFKALLEADLLELDSKANINPNKPLSRGEMAKIIAISFDLEGTKHSLKDVSSKFDKYVSALYENDVTTGYEDKTFKENNSLTRSHFAVFMYRAMNHKKEVNENTDSETGVQNPIEMDEDNIKYAEMISVFGMKKEDIPRPKGLTTEIQNNKHIEIRVKEKHNRYGSIAIATDLISGEEKGSAVYNTLSELTGTWVMYRARNQNMEIKDFIQIINNVIKTGEVYNGGDFALYYNYDNGLIYYSNRV